MHRIFVTILSLAWILSACAGNPPAQPVESSPPAAETRPAQAPPAAATTPELPSAAAPKTGMSKTPAALECLDRPLADGFLISRWDADESANYLEAVDPRTGARLCTPRPIRFRSIGAVAISPDREALAVVDYRDESMRNGTLHLVDLQAWEPITTTVQLTDTIRSMAFDPSGSMLAIVRADRRRSSIEPQQYSILQVDLASQAVTASRQVGFEPQFVRFTPDGKALLLFGGQEDPEKDAAPQGQLAVLDASALDIQWETAFPEIRTGMHELDQVESMPFVFEYWQPAIVFAPGAMRLYIVHADSDRLTTIDLITRTATTLEIRPQVSWIERLLALGTTPAHAKAGKGAWKNVILSSDGETLYIAGHRDDTGLDDRGILQVKSTPLPLQAVDIRTGRELARLEGTAGSLSLAPDGEHLILRGWDEEHEYTGILDPGSLEVLQRIENASLANYRTIGGEPMLVLERTTSVEVEIQALDAWEDVLEGRLPEMGGWQMDGYPLIYDN